MTNSTPTGESDIRRLLSTEIPQAKLGPDVLAIFNRAVASFLLEDYSKSETLLGQLVAAQDDPRWLLNYGFLQYHERRYDDALATYRKLIESHPYFVEAYLNAFKTCLVKGDLEEARRYCDAAQKLAPNRADVKQAKALYHFERGETSKYLQVFADVPESAVFASPSDNDIERLKRNPSVLVGECRIDVMVIAFAGAGLRTILVGYRDDNNEFPRPRSSHKWMPLTDSGRKGVSVESIDVSESVAMVGYRINGKEEPTESDELLGMLKASFWFDDFADMQENNYVGLMCVDHDRHLRLEPRQIFKRELTGIAEGDLVSLHQSITHPSSQYTSGTEQMTAKVFLSYASEDGEIVDDIFKRLKKHGLDVWKDNKELRIGESWEDKINEAIERADFAIVFLSSRSVKKVGYVQKEFRKIIETSKYRPFGFPFTLPVKLDDCAVPREFAQYQWAQLGDDRKGFVDKIADDIHAHHQQLRKDQP